MSRHFCFIWNDEFEYDCIDMMDTYTFVPFPDYLLSTHYGAHTLGVF